VVVLLGEPTAELGGSEYLSRIHGTVAGAPPTCDLDRERVLIDALLESIAGGAVRSAHDCADGGLAVALAECCMMDRNAQFGATIDLTSWANIPTRALLFGEAQGRVVLSATNAEAVLAIAKKHGVPARVIGRVTAAGTPLQISTSTARVDASLAELDEAYHESIRSIMSQSISN